MTTRDMVSLADEEEHQAIQSLKMYRKQKITKQNNKKEDHKEKHGKNNNNIQFSE